MLCMVTEVSSSQCTSPGRKKPKALGLNRTLFLIGTEILRDMFIQLKNAGVGEQLLVRTGPSTLLVSEGGCVIRLIRVRLIRFDCFKGKRSDAFVIIMGLVPRRLAQHKCIRISFEFAVNLTDWSGSGFVAYQSGMGLDPR